MIVLLDIHDGVVKTKKYKYLLVFLFLIGCDVSNICIQTGEIEVEEGKIAPLILQFTSGKCTEKLQITEEVVEELIILNESADIENYTTISLDNISEKIYKNNESIEYIDLTR